MKIAIIGLWHLGCVTAACLANEGRHVIAYDPNEDTIQLLKNAKTPLFEPGLDVLLTQNTQLGKIHYTSTLSDLSQAEIAWITFDTPVDDNDIADINSVTSQIKNIFPHLQNNTLVLISSQLPVGSTRLLLEYCNQQFSHKKLRFAYSPENLRLGKAIEVFTHPDRVIVGLQDDNLPSNINIAIDHHSQDKNFQDKIRITELFKPFTDNIIWMSLESAEMTKHALNAFLATSVVFINELSTLCEKVGANAAEVEIGLKSEERIGKKAYLRPGNAIAGGTLARDVNYLVEIGHRKSLETPLFSALLKSNEAHKHWSCRRIIDILKDLKNKT
ncbi:MAG: UDP-glucose/GDP-mannose dehydrogenase family protein, partial [Gammaproteobacteria bacterium]|nr:UDP-glucose/GDP-mannose dehydrogenase family protein [Gammaproteobacteria bacterium]